MTIYKVKNGKANINLYSKFKKNGLKESKYDFSFSYKNNNNIKVAKLQKTIKFK